MMNIQIIKSVVCDTNKGSLYLIIKPHLVDQHSFVCTDGDCLRVEKRFITDKHKIQAAFMF